MMWCVYSLWFAVKRVLSLGLIPNDPTSSHVCSLLFNQIHACPIQLTNILSDYLHMFINCLLVPGILTVSHF